MGARSSSEQESTSAPAHIKLVRVVDRTIHVSPTARQKEVDFTVQNTSDKEFNFIFLPLREFATNLKVHDEDGTRLNVYPNSDVEDMLEKVKEEDEAGYRRLEHRFKHADYKLFIQLPGDRPLSSGEMRTIQLTFEESDTVDFQSLTDPSLWRGWRSQWQKKFFEIPTFYVDVERFPGHPHDVFVNVIGTPGYACTGNTNKEGGDTTSEIHENGLDDDTRALSVRLPPADSKRYDWDMEYDLVPDNSTLMQGLAIYWVCTVILGVISILLAANGVGMELAKYGRTLSTGLITGTIGLIFALDADWTERYQIMCVLPLLLHAVSWIMWSTAASPTNP